MNIYIDCSRVYVFGGNHGIPRVVRSLINNTEGIKSYKITPVVMSFGKFRKVKKVPNRSENILIFLKKIKSLIKYEKISSTISNNNSKKNGRSIIYDIFTLPLIFNKKVSPQKGDVFITLDNFLMSVFSEYIQYYKNNGVIICSLIHDLIPIRYSKFYPQEDVLTFKTNLKNSLKFCDICITVSDYVKLDLENYIKENAATDDSINKKILIGSYKHGFDIKNNLNQNISYSRFDKIFKRPTYIIVSTIEPRKGHSYLLDAFEKIWESGIEVNLLIIGKLGWMIGDLIKRIKSHKQFEKQLFMYNDVSDSELLYCYINAKALITPSVTEGFGLPIIEALSQKTAVLASDIPVFREVGGDFCNYFDLSSPNNLAEIIINWEKNGVKPECRNINEFKWPTWKESAEEFIKKVVTLSAQIK